MHRLLFQLIQQVQVRKQITAYKYHLSTKDNNLGYNRKLTPQIGYCDAFGNIINNGPRNVLTFQFTQSKVKD